MAVTSTTVVAPILVGRRDALVAALAAVDAADPFAAVPVVHLARLEIIGDELLLGVTHDGPFEAVMAAVADRLDAVWRCCADADRVPALVEFATNGDAGVEEVRAALAAHDRLRDFAVRAQAMDATALRAAFRREFPA